MDVDGTLYNICILSYISITLALFNLVLSLASCNVLAVRFDSLKESCRAVEGRVVQGQNQGYLHVLPRIGAQRTELFGPNDPPV